jgi:hypothetical protein
MRLTTATVLLIWQAGKFWRLWEDRRFRRRERAFWKRHEKNMDAIWNGRPKPYPNNSFDWNPANPTESAHGISCK